MAVEKLFEFLEILFQRAEEVALMERGCRVQEGEKHKILHIEGLRFHLGDTHLTFQEGLSSPVAQGADQLRSNQLNLLQEKRLTRFHFVLLWIAIVGRPALDDVRNVDVIARETCRGEEVVQELAGCSDERFPFLIFIETRRFPDEHDTGVRIPDAEHNLTAPQLG